MTEFVNQWAGLGVITLCFCLTDFVPDGDTRFMIGWVILGLMASFLSINIGIQIQQASPKLKFMALGLYFKFKNWRHRNRSPEEKKEDFNAFAPNPLTSNRKLLEKHRRHRK